MNLPLILSLLCTLADLSPTPSNLLKNPLFDFLTAFGGGAPKSAGPVFLRKSASESVVWERTTTGSRGPVPLVRIRLGVLRIVWISSGSRIRLLCRDIVDRARLEK